MTAAEYAWQDDAACRGNSPMWDLDSYKASPDAPLMSQLATPAMVCGRCPVRVECEAWADAQLADDQALDCVAAGFIYRNVSNGLKSKKPVVWRECANCREVLYKHDVSYCSRSCVNDARASA